MKKILLSALSFLLVVGVSTSGVFALETTEDQTEGIIDIANEYIINENGLLVITSKDHLKKKLSVQEYDFVVENINYSNQLLKSKEVEIKENGSLYLVNDDSLIVQGGNINATRLYWWGWHRYNSDTNTKKIIKSFRKQVNYSNSGIAGYIFGALDNVPGGFLITSIPDLIGGSLTGFANALEKKNKKYGTIIAANWVVFGSNIKSQTKNTK